jgi:GntR family transcriptional regulator, transcriptional repressor for pyruvate dehydrogenase complex
MSAGFDELRIEPAYRKVAAALMERILERTLVPGEHLPPEIELARQLGVHRSTVREALRELETNGLLARRRGSKRMMVTLPERAAVAGGVSRALALHDVRFQDVWETMNVLEPSIAEAAARRRTAADLERLTEAAALFREHNSESLAIATASAVREVAAFFRVLGECAHNPVMQLAHEPLLQLLEPSLGAMIDRVPQARSRIITAEARILAAIRERDAASAREWMAKHIRDFKRGYDFAGIALTEPVALPSGL